MCTFPSSHLPPLPILFLSPTRSLSSTGSVEMDVEAAPASSTPLLLSRAPSGPGSPDHMDNVKNRKIRLQAVSEAGAGGRGERQRTGVVDEWPWVWGAHGRSEEQELPAR